MEEADTRCATSGQSALALVAGAWFPDAVLTHVRLPDMTGRDLVSAVTRRAPARIALLCTTSDARLHAQTRARDEGFDACLVKPVNVDALCAEILATVQGVRGKAP